MQKSLEESISYLEDWSSTRFQEIEDAVNKYVDESISEIEKYRSKNIRRIRSFQESSEKNISDLLSRLQKLEDMVGRVVSAKENQVGKVVDKVERAKKRMKVVEPVAPAEEQEVPVKVLQSLSYTVFDTILLCITNGQAPDFTLISQSVLFSCVYPNISRGYSSYLFRDVPPSGVAAIHQGKGILKELREKESEFLDTKENWDKYAEQIQKWWINVAPSDLHGCGSRLVGG